MISYPQQYLMTSSKNIGSGFIICISLILNIFNAKGQDNIKIRRISTQIEFDGRPDEQAWKDINFYPLTMHRPNFGGEPSEKSEIMVAYDDEFLWIGARLFMKDVKLLYTPSKKRDEDVRRSFDSFGVLLDTYNDNENGLAFFTTPTGLRTDYAVSNDAVGPGPGPGGTFAQINFSWNTFWDVMTTSDESGWYLEMRIPFSSLRFKPENDLTTMGMIISRTISHNNETDTYPVIDPKYGTLASFKASLASNVEFESVRPAKPVYISPYIISGFSRNYSLNDEETDYLRKDDPTINAGLDVKYSISSNLTLDLTANTDFAQVEADNQQVNLTRYSLFFPEKRMFFQERSSLFSFSLGEMSDLFYSRNIGISDGNQVRIYGGARLVGKLGDWDVGIINMQTEKFEDNPGENFGVYRLRRQVINPNSFVGGILTSRLGMNGDQNFAYGLDGIFRIYGDDYITLKAARTYDNNTGGNIASLDPSFFSALWERRSEKGITYNLNYLYTGQKFNPGVGFVRRDSLQGFNYNVMYNWLPGTNSRWFNYSLGITGEYFTRLSDGDLESMMIGPEIRSNTKKGFHFDITALYHQEGVREDFDISDSISVKAGVYKFSNIVSRINTPRTKPVSARIQLEGGEYYDGLNFGASSMMSFNLSSSFQLIANYGFNAIRFPEREKFNNLNIHSASFNATYMLNTKISASALVQYISTEDELIANFRFRYNPREGNDLYLVFDDSRSIDERYHIVPLPKYFSRTILLKYTHTFIL